MDVGQRDRQSRSTLSQINVTPFVDVMLVLLIIFMVTAPMMETGVEVNLPEVDGAPPLERQKEPLILTVKKNGTIYVGKTALEGIKRLPPVLKEIVASKKEKEVLLEADRDVPYGEVVKVMAVVREAGVQKLGMVARPPER